MNIQAIETEKQKRQDRTRSKPNRDEPNSPVVFAIGLYLIVATLTVILIATPASAHKISPVFLAILIALVTVLPLLLTAGVFAAYRVAYQKMRGQAFMKALEWNRYALPLSFLNLLVTLCIGFLLYEDIRYTQPLGGVILGTFAIPLRFGSDKVNIPSMLFYWAYGGFFVYTLQATFRRYTTNNLVPHFYISRIFHWIYTSVAAVLIYLAAQVGTDLLNFSTTLSALVTKPEFLMLLAFVVGMSPIGWIDWISAKVRRKFGLAVAEKLPLSAIDGIDHTLEAFLHEENVSSVQELAKSGIDDLSGKTGFPPDVIRHWQSQARLLSALGESEVIRRFRRAAINDFDDLQILNQIKSIEELTETTLTTALSAEDKTVMEKPEYWSVLIRVLKHEYQRDVST